MSFTARNNLDENLAWAQGPTVDRAAGFINVPSGQVPAGQEPAAARRQVQYTTAAQHAAWFHGSWPVVRSTRPSYTQSDTQQPYHHEVYQRPAALVPPAQQSAGGTNSAGTGAASSLEFDDDLDDDAFASIDLDAIMAQPSAPSAAPAAAPLRNVSSAQNNANTAVRTHNNTARTPSECENVASLKSQLATLDAELLLAMDEDRPFAHLRCPRRAATRGRLGRPPKLCPTTCTAYRAAPGAAPTEGGYPGFDGGTLLPQMRKRSVLIHCKNQLSIQSGQLAFQCCHIFALRWTAKLRNVCLKLRLGLQMRLKLGSVWLHDFARRRPSQFLKEKEGCRRRLQWLGLLLLFFLLLLLAGLFHTCRKSLLRRWICCLCGRRGFGLVDNLRPR